MEDKEAQSVIGNLYDALFKAKVAIDSRINYQKERLAIEERLKEMQKEVKQLKEDRRIQNILISAYSENSNIKVGICPDCNGCGGFEWQDEGGGGAEPCQTCNQSGYFIQQKEVKWVGKE